MTIYEFSDFECPHCRAMNEILKQVEAENPKIRIVFKNFPLTQIHPWAETAAIGAHCASIQKPEAFWTIHDLIFDNQDVISAENVWDKLVSFTPKPIWMRLVQGVFRLATKPNKRSRRPQP